MVKIDHIIVRTLISPASVCGGVGTLRRVRALGTNEATASLDYHTPDPASPSSHAQGRQGATVAHKRATCSRCSPGLSRLSRALLQVRPPLTLQRSLCEGSRTDKKTSPLSLLYGCPLSHSASKPSPTAASKPWPALRFSPPTPRWSQRT